MKPYAMKPEKWEQNSKLIYFNKNVVTRQYNYLTSNIILANLTSGGLCVFNTVYTFSPFNPSQFISILYKLILHCPHNIKLFDNENMANDNIKQNYYLR